MASEAPAASRRGWGVWIGGLALAAACVAFVLLAGAGSGPSELEAKRVVDGHGNVILLPNWSLFNQQLAHDWTAKLAAAKAGDSSREIAAKREKLMAEKRLVAQKKLEMKKFAAEERMEHLERRIEEEASTQLDKRNGMLSSAIVQNQPATQPSVVFSGSFVPGMDAKSPGEAAAEMAAWGPSGNSDWSKVLSEERQQGKALRDGTSLAPAPRFSQPEAAYTTPALVRSAAAVATKAQAPPSGPKTTSEIEHEALETQKALREEAEAALAAHGPNDGWEAILKMLPQKHKEAVKPAVSKAAGEAKKHGEAKAKAAHEATKGNKVKDSAVARASAEVSSLLKKLEKVEGQTVKLTDQRLQNELEALVKSKEKTSTPLQAKSREEVEKVGVLQLHAEMLRKKLKQASAFNNVLKGVKTSLNAVPAPAPAIGRGHVKCCDDACVSVSTECGAKKEAKKEEVGGLPKDTLIQWLVSGTPAEKARAAALLYAARGDNSGLAASGVGGKGEGGHGGAQKAVADGEMKPVYTKGPFRCCDSSCVSVGTTCENTHAMDTKAVSKLKEGKKVPSNKHLTEWLISGTPAEKDEAASLLYTESQRQGKHFMEHSQASKPAAVSQTKGQRGNGRVMGSVAQAGSYSSIAQGIVDAVNRQGH